ncbi:Phospholipase A2 [Cricetulus griseus]|nr:Phospholipase A2 [Cricetulus griseus]
MECTIQGSHPLKDYNTYSCFCGSYTPVDELDRCCKAQDHCYDQAKKLEICTFPHSPYTTPYSFSCSGNEVTCSDENDACEAFICNCDLQAAICFSKASYTKKNKGIHC